jgi:hypothetical protein
VTTAHETSDAFNNEVLREYEVFQLAKRIEMRDLLTGLADGQIQLSKAVRAYAHCVCCRIKRDTAQTIDAYDKTVPVLEKIHAN